MSTEDHRQLHFEFVNDENRKKVESLSLFSEQVGFIESVSECLQEADELDLWRPVGIYDGDTDWVCHVWLFSGTCPGAAMAGPAAD